MKTIPLSRRKIAYVDDRDYKQLIQHKWFAYKAQNGAWYAARNQYIGGRRSRIVLMHRQILRLKVNDRREADHKNHHGLDNTRSNLRLATKSQNAMNRKPYKEKSSQFKGVCWHGDAHKWVVHIKVNRKQKHLGLFKSEIEAAKAYDSAAKKYFGEFAYLNFD